MARLHQALLAPALALCAGAPAQQLLWRRVGSPPPYYVGFVGSAAVVEDVDGDGFDDVVQVGSSLNPRIGLWTLSGVDGSTLRVWAAESPFECGLQAVASAGDMDGDGRGDHVITRSCATSSINFVQARSGWDDRLLWQVTGSFDELFGEDLLGGLELDGDGRPDVLVGHRRGAGFAGQVHAFANDGRLLYTATAAGTGELGYRLAQVGDVDGDGCDEFVASAAGLAVLFSGRTGQELVRGFGDPRSGIGEVTGCGDLDGDGKPDFAGGTVGGFGVLGLAQAFSSRTGEEIYRWSHPHYPSSSWFGVRLDGGQDLDFDGVEDVLIYGSTSPMAPLGSVFAYSGRDGTEMLRIEPTSGGFLGMLSGMRPQPGDPFPRFLGRVSHTVSYPGGALDVGKVELYSTRPTALQRYGARCKGALETEPAIGIRALPPATPGVRLHLSGGEPGGQGLLLLGLSRTSLGGIPLPYPLSRFGFSGCLLQTSIEATVPVTLGSSGLARGYGSVDLPWALGTSLGVTLHGQWLALGTGVTAPGGATEGMSWQH